MGSYYTFSPHEVYAGYGGFGSIAADFSANAVWADVQLGASCYTGQAGANTNIGQCNAAGGRAANMIRVGLNELGYGPLQVGTSTWTSANPGNAWNRFLADHGLPPGPGLGISLQGLMLMEQLLKEGKKPGPAQAVSYKKVNGQLIPTGDKGLEIAGMSGGTLLLAAAVVGGVGYLAWKSGQKKKRGGAYGSGSSTAMTLRR
jgi:hypothetical protein